MTWELAYKIGVEMLQIWKPYAFPSPFNVFESIYLLAKDNTLFIAIGASMKRLLIGYGISLVIGVLVGLFIVRYKYIGENLLNYIKQKPDMDGSADIYSAPFYCVAK